MNETDWTRIVSEAKEQATAELIALEHTLLEYGQPIAWVVCRYRCTDALSTVHRVGDPKGASLDPYTTCGEAIPHPALWLPLSPALVRSMDSCGFCKAEYARQSRERAA